MNEFQLFEELQEFFEQYKNENLSVKEYMFRQIIENYSIGDTDMAHKVGYEEGYYNAEEKTSDSSYEEGYDSGYISGMLEGECKSNYNEYCRGVEDGKQKAIKS